MPPCTPHLPLLLNYPAGLAAFHLLPPLNRTVPGCRQVFIKSLVSAVAMVLPGLLLPGATGHVALCMPHLARAKLLQSATACPLPDYEEALEAHNSSSSFIQHASKVNPGIWSMTAMHHQSEQAQPAPSHTCMAPEGTLRIRCHQFQPNRPFFTHSAQSELPFAVDPS